MSKQSSKNSPPGPRSRARALAISGLYQLDLLEKDLDEIIKEVRAEASEDSDGLYYLTSEDKSKALDFFEELLRGTWDKREDIDKQLGEKLENWSLDRLGHIERAILRLGAFELKFRSDIPQKVSLNEMVELSKSFCDLKSKDLVNGVLDAIAS